MGVKTGPKLVVDYMITYQLLGMDEFWEALPPLLAADLREAGREAHAKALKIATGGACAGCSSIKSAVWGVHCKLWHRLDLLSGVEPQAVAPLVAAIAAKRGYRPSVIEVYYKDEAGHSRKLAL